MSFLTVVLLIAVIALWSRLRTLEQRVSLLDRGTLDPVMHAGSEPPAPLEVKPRSGTVTIVNRPVEPVVTEPVQELGSVTVQGSEISDVPQAPQLETATSPRVASVKAAPAQPKKIEFEELFGHRLPIWAGGITLAVAGLFIVKYSIDAGLLSPAVRVILGLLFSFALVAGAEVARRWKETAIDPRVAQALAGAGIASAYTSILIATNLYHLVSPATGFIGLALTTAGALALALRFGSPAAVLGLVGGLAAPALVGESTNNIAPLTAYLALVIGGLSAVGRRKRWAWLTASALIGGFGWGLLLIAFKTLDSGNTAALGGYTLLLAFAIPLLLGGAKHDRWMRAAAGTMGAIQIALIVMQGGYGALDWGFYGLLSAGAIILARIDTKQAMLPPIALGIGLVTMAGWDHPTGSMLAFVSGGFIVLFAGSALATIWTSRGSLRDAIQAAVALGGALAVACFIAPVHLLSPKEWSLLALAAAAPLSISALLGARRELPHRDPRFLALVLAAALLSCIAMPELFDQHALPAIYALGVAGLVELWRRRTDLDYRGALAIVLLAAAASMVETFTRWLGGTLLTLGGEPLYVVILPKPFRALTDLILPAIILSGSVWRIRSSIPPKLSRVLFGIGGVLAAAGLFILYKQIFLIDSGSAFTARGLLERVVLDQLLFAIGWQAMSRRDLLPGLREFGLAAIGLALMRTVLYNALLFDPLWRDQLVGVLPLANLLIPAFLLPLFWLTLAVRDEPVLAAKFKPGITAIQMSLITLFVAATLRQAFHGSLLAVGGVGPGEDISRSLAAIALAVGFLRWGIFKRERPWRIASLVLMLVAVIKVFVVDTSGLEGLMRIGSFVALGFSLIGIGWLYSRHLSSDAPLTTE